MTLTTPALSISREKICFFIVKAREFDVKDVVTDPDSGSNPSDDAMISVLEDHADDATQQELRMFIDALTEDEQIDLVASYYPSPLSPAEAMEITNITSLADRPYAKLSGCHRSPRFVMRWITPS